MARKKVVTEEVRNILYERIANGETYKAACACAGISIDTFVKLKQKDAEFNDFIRKAQKEYNEWRHDEILIEARTSLKQLIKGFKYKEITVESETDERGFRREKKRKEVEKMVTPNATAIIFALCNRDPENWKHRQTTDINAEVKAEAAIKPDLSAIPDALIQEVLDKLDAADRDDNSLHNDSKTEL